MPKACDSQEDNVRALGLGHEARSADNANAEFRGRIAPAVLSRHSSLHQTGRKKKKKKKKKTI